MAKVTLLGDSIRQIGYGTKVPEMLGKDFDVFQPDDNCRFVKYTLRMLFDLQEQMKGSDIVHWNNGLWDVCELFDNSPFTSVDEYVESMLRVADILQKRHKIVIFATTTPVRKENPHNKNSVIEHYNSVLVPKLQERGIIINDLYSLVAQDIEKYIRGDDLIHLTDEGIDLCAKQVTKVILEAAKTL